MHKLIVANYKMNGNKFFFHSLQKKIKKSKDTEIILCPPFVYLNCLKNKKGFYVGAQNVSCEVNGKRTGDVSADMLADVGVKYCIVGHSERSQPYSTDEIIARKVENCVKNGIIPIICFGETFEQDNACLEQMINNAIKYVNSCNVIFAYEPVWAIGTGKTATAEMANETCGYVRSVVESLYGNEVAETIRIQYGGSVKSSNANELFTMSDIDGGLVGGASLEPTSFLGLLEAVSK